MVLQFCKKSSSPRRAASTPLGQGGRPAACKPRFAGDRLIESVVESRLETAGQVVGAAFAIAVAGHRRRAGKVVLTR